MLKIHIPKVTVICLLLNIYMANDAISQQQWIKTYGSSAWEFLIDIEQTDDDGYIVAAWTDSLIPNRSDMYILKLDEFGDTLWTKLYGGNEFDEPRYIKQTVDGGYIILGFMVSFEPQYSGPCVFKLDSLGDSLPQRLTLV